MSEATTDHTPSVVATIWRETIPHWIRRTPSSSRARDEQAWVLRADPLGRLLLQIGLFFKPLRFGLVATIAIALPYVTIGFAASASYPETRQITGDGLLFLGAATWYTLSYAYALQPKLISLMLRRTASLVSRQSHDSWQTGTGINHGMLAIATMSMLLLALLAVEFGFRPGDWGTWYWQKGAFFYVFFMWVFGALFYIGLMCSLRQSLAGIAVARSTWKFVAGSSSVAFLRDSRTVLKIGSHLAKQVVPWTMGGLFVASWGFFSILVNRNIRDPFLLLATWGYLVGVILSFILPLWALSSVLARLRRPLLQALDAEMRDTLRSGGESSKGIAELDARRRYIRERAPLLALPGFFGRLWTLLASVFAIVGLVLRVVALL